MRDTLLFLHIAGAAGWIGGGLYLVWASTDIVKSKDQAAAKAIAVIMSGGNAYFGIVSGLLLLSGIGLVFASDAYGWGSVFVWIGIGVFAVTGIWQGVFGTKKDDEFAEAVSQGDRPLEALRRWRRYSFIDFGLLGVALWAMVTKIGA